MANWLDIGKLAEWEFPVITGYQYDSISNKEIKAALDDVSVLKNVDSGLDWEDDEWLSESKEIAQEMKHSYRVAALVYAILNGGKLREAISLDTYSAGKCCSCIPNGHHRIRALQYLGKACAPFDLSGDLDVLEDLVDMAGVDAPADAVAWCEQKITKLGKHDVRCRRSNKKRAKC